MDQGQGATNPHQYDSSDTNWKAFGDENSPSRIFLRNSLESFVDRKHIIRKKVVDIGSGAGYLSKWLQENGAKAIVGFGPSIQNIKISRSKYPHLYFEIATLRDYSKNSNQQFDTAFAVMVFEHILDLNSAFKDISKLLDKKGNLYVVIGNKDYHVRRDRDQSPQIIEFKITKDYGDGTVETKVVRKVDDTNVSVLYDLFRPLEKIKEAAEVNGFKAIK